MTKNFAKAFKEHQAKKQAKIRKQNQAVDCRLRLNRARALGDAPAIVITFGAK